MKHLVDKDSLQTYTTKLVAKLKTVFSVVSHTHTTIPNALTVQGNIITPENVVRAGTAKNCAFLNASSKLVGVEERDESTGVGTGLRIFSDSASFRTYTDNGSATKTLNLDYSKVYWEDFTLSPYPTPYPSTLPWTYYVQAFNAGGYSKPQYRLFGDKVDLRGGFAVRLPRTASEFHINIPSAYCPSQTLTFRITAQVGQWGVFEHEEEILVSITPNGYISVEGFTFSVPTGTECGVRFGINLCSYFLS